MSGQHEPKDVPELLPCGVLLGMVLLEFFRLLANLGI